MLVIGDIELRLFAHIALCPQLLALASEVILDNGVCSAQDMPRAAVVLLKADNAAALVLILEREDIFYCRAAELINALIVVADDADIAPALGELGREHVL